MKRLLRTFAILTISVSVSSSLLVAEESENQTIKPSLVKALKYRLIGPFRGGRSTAVEGIPDEPHTYYMGSTGGGVWRTDDAGQNWANITDKYLGVGSVGAIAVAPSDSNVIYVGTGSSSPRGNISVGDGVYKSTDRGKTWTHVGLPKAGLISRIRIHPDDHDVLYVAAMGNIFGPNPERGVYRSTDGGENWEKVLFVSDKTGAADLAMDVTNPRILYAGVWTVQRLPWTLIDGSDEGGVYKTTDGGTNWKKLEDDLPKQPWGRVGVSVSRTNPDRVWVLVETEGGGVFRSDDGGDSFEKVNTERKLRSRAWYYTRIYADPTDENTAWVTNSGLYKSIDGGKTFDRIQVPHGDNHDVWVNPTNPDLVINANDGGANVSLNGTRTWSTQYNQPTSEFYRVTVDNQFPYRVYGAQQDNSTISVPSWSPGGISPKQHWFAVGGGESGHIAVDPRDPNIIFAGNYIGQITRLDRARWHGRDIVAYPQMHDGMAAKDIKYRFQWNAPIRISPHDPDVLYHTSQFVHRSFDAGQTWEVISPDLTTDNKDYQELPGGPIQHDHTGVELYTTIFSFEESPHQKGLLWAGSDDGLVHISRNDGKEWTNITPPGMPKDGTVNMIDLSAHDAGRAHLAVYRYRRGDLKPYVFQTNDFGATWRLVTDGTNGIPEDDFVRVVREDPERKGLLFAGTERHMYVSFDDGMHWQSLQLNLPKTPITDLAVHRKDLVVATQGRSFWILDDLSPLHQMQAKMAEEKAVLFTPRVAYRTQIRGFRGGAAPETPPRGVRVYFFLKEKPEDTTQLDFLDSEGKLIRSFSTKKPDGDSPWIGATVGSLKPEAGLNAFDWDLTYMPPRVLKGSIMSLARVSQGPQAAPGSYQVKLRVGDWEQTADFSVSHDPRWTVSEADLRAQFELAQQVSARLTAAHEAIHQIREVREQAKQIVKRAEENGKDPQGLLEEASEALADTLTKVEETLIQTKNETGQDPINFPPRLDNQIAYLFSIVNGQDARPTKASYERFEDVRKELDEILAQLKTVMGDDFPRFERLIEKAGVTGILVP